METFKSFARSLETINEQSFDDIALQLFRFQASNNPVYALYLKHLQRKVADISAVNQIPFLPISFFKSHMVKTGNWNEVARFSSSGTTGSITSSHAVFDIEFYKQHSERLFVEYFGSPEKYHILALLPSYLERQGSSLIVMVEHLIKRSNSVHSGFYLHNHDALIKKLEALRSDSRKVILLGVSFALLDLADVYDVDLSHCIVMETGGMKGRRKELIREELHSYLKQRFHVEAIYSEYGMTEMMSQAYSMGAGLYKPSSSMKVLTRSINDPFEILPGGKTGGINLIDLANFHSCAFIETQDLGTVHQSGQFEVLGRMDNSDVRGCNLLVG